MKSLLALFALVLLSACSGPGRGTREPGRPRLVHDVYFVLKEDTSEVRSALIRDCLGLRGLGGVLGLWVGPRGEDFARETNDVEFDIALHVVFRDRPAHDLYQVSAQHQALLAAWRDRFESVRVFDSWAVGF